MYSVVYMTASSRVEAEMISKALVEAKLVACVNVLGDITSFFNWEDSLKYEQEVAFVAKTRTSHVPYVIEKVKELHSYDVPCIISVPIGSGSQEFLDWIGKETTV